MASRDSYHAEMRVLATALVTGELPDNLGMDSFAYRDHAVLWGHMDDCLSKLGKLSPEILADYLETDVGVDLRDWLTGFADHAMQDATLMPAYVDMILEIRASDDLRTTLDTIAHMDTDDPKTAKDKAISALEGIAFGRKSRGLLQVCEYLGSVIAQIDERFNSDSIPGVVTGLPTLDRFTGGWHKSDLSIVAARPAVGKTAFALNITIAAAMHGKRVNFVSAEQPAEQIVHRLLAIIGQIPAWKLRTPRSLHDAEWARLTSSSMRLRDQPIAVLDHSSPSVADISAAMRSSPCDLVIIDYLQRLKSPGAKSSYDRVSEIAMALKELARSFDVPVVALAQINRQGAENARMEHLKGSGDIEQEADQVLILERKKDSEEATLSLEKNRHGPTGLVDLYFQAETMRFVERAEDQQ